MLKYNVYAYSCCGVKKLIDSFATKSLALEFCIANNWEWTDDNSYIWALDYEKGI